MADSDPSSRPRVDVGAALPLPAEVALVLQGGGALGAFQGGVMEGMAAAGIRIDRVAGISIGAINAALIAGNPPEERVPALRRFWDRVTSGVPSLPIGDPDDWTRGWLHAMAAGWVTLAGVPGFFERRVMPPWLGAPGTAAALSYYDPSALAGTLDEMVDWTLLNDGPVRVALGAVDVESGNFRYFDSRHERLDARHVMASGALPPAFPPVEIDGRLYWDGGIVSNTPLVHVLDTQDEAMLVFQVDLFSAKADPPRTIDDVQARAKEIRFSSRTRAVSDMALRLRREREAICRVMEKLPAPLADDPDVVALRRLLTGKPVHLVQLVNRADPWMTGARDYEFSRRTMEGHWAAGRDAFGEAISGSAVIARDILDGSTAAYDLGGGKRRKSPCS